jgi:uncharacterized protein YyaL (SSP411 family)
MPTERPSNRLIHEKSPYLLQHAYNPVAWYPWGDEAFAKARTEGKPIFLSVGYSTCHWCHVMEKESFEDEEIARLLNEHFVAIKVDREERPDVDRIYMSALQAMGQEGGWPMSMFLLPDLKPFWGGTYFPPVSRYGRTGFPEILRRIHQVWTAERSKAEEAAESMLTYLKDLSRNGSSGQRVLGDSLELGLQQLEKTYDPVHGGFGGGPKFPRPSVFEFLLRYFERTGSAKAREMVETTLDRMAAGGIYDHVGGGFHRYAVDREWRVPHFEKMLYDQAQLVSAYADAYLLSRKPVYARVIRETVGYVLRDMTHAEGGFSSAEDADSSRPESPEESGEGAFYLWTAAELGALLGPSAIDFCAHYGVEEGGNATFDPQQEFTGRNILYVAHPLEEMAISKGVSAAEISVSLEASRQKVFEARCARPRPHCDDKVLTSWNGLMVSALVKASRTVGESSYKEAASRAAEFVFARLYDPASGVLRRRFRDHESKFDGFLDDYAFFTQGLIDLYESTGEFRWLRSAVSLTEKQIELFWDGEHGAFFDTAGGDPSVLVRIKDHHDGAEPTGNSVSLMNLLRLAQITNRSEWRRKAEQILDVFAPILTHQPVALPHMSAGLLFSESQPIQVVLAGSPGDREMTALRREVFSRYVPGRVVLHADGAEGQEFLAEQAPAIRGMVPIDGKPTAYVCRDFVCTMPTSDAVQLSRLLDAG